MSYKPVAAEGFGGLNLVDDPGTVGWNHAVDLLNVELDHPERVRSRDGFKSAYTSGGIVTRVQGFSEGGLGSYGVWTTSAGTTTVQMITAAGATQGAASAAIAQSAAYSGVLHNTSSGSTFYVPAASNGLRAFDTAAGCDRPGVSAINLATTLPNASASSSPRLEPRSTNVPASAAILLTLWRMPR